MSRTRATVFTLALGSALLGACGGEGPTLRIDLSSVAHQALAQPLDEVELQVTSRTGTVSSTLDPSDLVFEATTDPGPILVAATGRSTSVQPALATYFGDAAAVVEPLGVTEVDFSMFQAGTLTVTVTISADFALPDVIRVRFNPHDPRGGESPAFFAPLRAGQLERVLPTGAYTFFAEASFDGTTFEQFGPAVDATVLHGSTTFVPLDF